MRSGKNPNMRHMGRTHKISVKWIHEQLTRDTKHLRAVYCDTKDMAADIFTKPFANPEKWAHARKLIGIFEPGEEKNYKWSAPATGTDSRKIGEARPGAPPKKKKNTEGSANAKTAKWRCIHEDSTKPRKENETLYVRIRNENGHEKSKIKIPFKATRESAGFDLASAENTTIPPYGRKLIKTGLSLLVPKGTYGRIAPRSGLALKHGLTVGAGVIDRDYRGDVGIVLFNQSPLEFKVNQGDLVAQLILEKHADTRAVSVVKDFPATERNEGGFGSTSRSQPKSK